MCRNDFYISLTSAYCFRPSLQLHQLGLQYVTVTQWCGPAAPPKPCALNRLSIIVL